MATLKDCLIIQKHNVNNKIIRIKERKSNYTTFNLGGQSKDDQLRQDISASKNCDNDNDLYNFKDNDFSDDSDGEKAAKLDDKNDNISMSSSDDNESDIKKSTQGSFQPLEALGINIFQIKPNNRNNIRINRSRLNLGNKSSKLLTYRANKNSDFDLKVVANSNEATRDIKQIDNPSQKLNSELRIK